MRTAVIQMCAGADKKKNIAGALFLVRKAIQKRATFILLPEVFNYRGKADLKKGYFSVAENIPGESSKPFMALARRHKVFILLGSLCEKSPRTHKVFNTSILINDKGKAIARYRKNHLFDAVVDGKTLKESRFFMPGKDLVTANVKDFKIGLSVCYDVRFPEMYRAYAKKGVDILCVPSSFTKTTGQAHWEILLRARAIENSCYVLAPDQFGFGHGGVETFGKSMIISPWGEVLACASNDKEGIIVADLSKDDLIKTRDKIPVKF
ncbi:MAG: carbon-nitrogen hydrolase family protein [Candidatus Omnitrophota bacterium]